MRFPLNYEIAEPPLRVVPVMARALRALGIGWKSRINGHEIQWEPREEDRAQCPLYWRLTPTGAPEGQSLLIVDQLPVEGEQRPSHALLHCVGRVRDVLHQQDIDTRPHLPASEVESGTTLLVAPDRPPYRMIATLLRETLGEWRQVLHFVTDPNQEPARFRQALRDASLVIAGWDSLDGRAALFLRWNRGLAAVALAPSAESAAEWPGTLVTYGQNRTAFERALDNALAQYLEPPDVAAAAPPLPEESLDAEGARQRRLRPLQMERLRIYRAVALDPDAPAEQRFHAARVLADAGDEATAADLLGTLAADPASRPLAAEALQALGSLGSAALPALWRLDARPMPPSSRIEVARQLARAGDTQTALFRLARLARHGSEETRVAALDAMSAGEEEASPHFVALATDAEDPRVRLAAIRWLMSRKMALGQVRATALELAGLVAFPDVAALAVGVLETVGDPASLSAVSAVARDSPSAEARLSAAEVLNRRGDTQAARAVLLTLAQGNDDLAAGAALDMLVNVSDEVTNDTTRLMTTATLKSVRRRAAELLSQPSQPEAVQQAAARVLLALERPALARPVLARLARGAEDLKIRRWAARQLAQTGEAGITELRVAFQHADDPVVGQHLAEGLLRSSELPDDRRQAAVWLAEHSNLPRAVEVLGDLALSGRVSGSDAVRATNDLNRYAGNWAGAARVLARLASESPHPAVRARALDLLLREHPSELPIAMLVDLAVTGSIGTADRYPVMQQLSILAEPAASRIAARVASPDVDTDRRFQLLQLVTELPDGAAISALTQLSARAPQDRIRYVAGEQLLARGQREAGYAALATVAINASEWELRERALYALAMGQPETDVLLRSIMERTRYEDTFLLARSLLSGRAGALAARPAEWLEGVGRGWSQFVARLPLSWVDRLIARLLTRQPPPSG